MWQIKCHTTDSRVIVSFWVFKHLWTILHIPNFDNRCLRWSDNMVEATIKFAARNWFLVWGCHYHWKWPIKMSWYCYHADMDIYLIPPKFWISKTSNFIQFVLDFQLNFWVLWSYWSHSKCNPNMHPLHRSLKNKLSNNKEDFSPLILT